MIKFKNIILKERTDIVLTIIELQVATLPIYLIVIGIVI